MKIYNKVKKRNLGILIIFIIVGLNSYAFGSDSKRFIDQTQIKKYKKLDKLDTAKFPGLEIIFTDTYEIVVNSKVKYREKNSSSTWYDAFGGMAIDGCHSITWNSATNAYYAVSFENGGKNQGDGKILKFDSINDPYPEEISIGSLVRPHFILYNPTDGYTYFVDADYNCPSKYLYRFKENGSGTSIQKINLIGYGYNNKKNEKILTNFYNKAYVRSFTIINGKIYITNASHGEVIKIDNLGNFSNNSNLKFTRFNSQKNFNSQVASSGTYETKKLVLNDIEYYNGFWYGANDFTEHMSLDENGNSVYDYKQYNLIRWKTWDDFENNRFQDLSHLIADNNSFPYNFTVNNGRLYVATFWADLYMPGFSVAKHSPAEVPPVYVLSPYNGDLSNVTYTTPLYRYWNSSIGDHFYTTEQNQPVIRINNYNYNFEGIQCYVLTINEPETIPMHRYWSEFYKDHFYTTTQYAPSRWEYQGLKFYVYPVNQSNNKETTSLFRYWNSKIGDHFYESNYDKLGSGKDGWNLEKKECDVVSGSSLINK